MKEAIAMKWVEALRSGEYKQAKNTLQDAEGGYCCLGVLCRLAAKEGVPVSERSPADPARPDEIGGGELGDQKAVQKWAGLAGGGGEVPYKTVVEAGLPKRLGSEGSSFNTLTELNDDAGWDFNQIAAFIETYWEVL